MKVLGIIPARAGSKGVPGKNSKVLNGKPLMQYTIEAALSSKLLSSVVFSSENQELIELAKSLGVKVPFVRPLELATDEAKSLDVVKDALKQLTEVGESYDAVCLLQVTSPFREDGFIDLAIEKFKISNTDSLVSVLKVPHEYNPHWVFEAKDGRLEIATGEKNIITRRQDLPITYLRDGSIYLTRTDVILNGDSLYGDTIGYIESNPDRHVNIDTIEDWDKAVFLAKKLKI